MADVFDKRKRSDIMKHVLSNGNKSPALKLIEIFKTNGITGWRRHYSVIGHPDFVFLNHRIAVFVDGCFWHGHDCRNTRPSENAEYWEKKRFRNIAHDIEITKRFEQRDWTVIRIWECELKMKNREVLVKKLKAILYSSNHCFNNDSPFS